MRTMKLDAFLHKTRIKVLRLDMCTSIISLSKIAHLKCGAITYSAKETRQQNEQLAWGWRQEGRGGGWTKFEEGSIGGWGLHKIEGVMTPLPTMQRGPLIRAKSAKG